MRIKGAADEKEKKTVTRMVIFTDLDGTLLDSVTYGFDAAEEALALVRERRIPLVLCSSKTRAEIEYYRMRLSNDDPFISENGGGIFVPSGSPLAGALDEAETESLGPYRLVRLGASYPDLRDALGSLRREGFGVRGFGDMTVDEVSRLTGLPAREAAMAKERDFDEPFVFTGDSGDLEALVRSVRGLGLSVTKGRFLHLLGNSDKGKAVSILSGLYARSYGEHRTVAIGDSPNDIPMLEHVDIPAVVEKGEGGYDPAIDVPNLVRVPGAGPKGWNLFVKTLITG